MTVCAASINSCPSASKNSPGEHGCDVVLSELRSINAILRRLAAGVHIIVGDLTPLRVELAGCPDGGVGLYAPARAGLGLQRVVDVRLRELDLKLKPVRTLLGGRSHSETAHYPVLPRCLYFVSVF